MDYISKKINEKVRLNEFSANYRDAAIQEQSHFEYLLLLILAYLWNKNFSDLDLESKAYCYQSISRPSIGKIVELCRKLDTKREVFGEKKLKKFQDCLNLYPSLRNEKIGHGYSFDDDAESLFTKMHDLCGTLQKEMPDCIGAQFELVNVLNETDVAYKGILYKANGEYSPWVIPKALTRLTPGYMYLKGTENYYNLSPFIQVENIDEFYTYSYIEDRLASRAVFNKLIKTGRTYFNVNDLVDDAYELDENRSISINGTIVNNYTNNYKKYIETEIVKKIIKFLKKNKSTVFATLWGHGGVGKTASIQRVCEALLTDETKTFDYIVFISAKNRHFNFYRGIIEAIDAAVSTYDDVIKFINKIVFNTDTVDPSQIIDFQGTMLLVLDDYETFLPCEKDKLIEFIKNLNIVHHKVVITTRSTSHITGEEIQVEELTPQETLQFFDSVLENELSLDPDIYKNEADPAQVKSALHDLTSGRPLFIFQSAVIYGSLGSISSLLGRDLKGKSEAIEFLYGRILDYLSIDGKKVFGAMGLLVSDEDLSNILSKLKYILNLEKEEYRFDTAIEELVKLKIIKIIDQKFFKVYSSEIATIMRDSFTDEGDAGGIISRLQLVGSDKKLDSDLSLLADADNSRISHKATEVINKYRHLISRIATPREIKIKAIINLAQYLIEDQGNYDQGTAIFSEFGYHSDCASASNFVRAHASYLWRGDDSNKLKAIESIRNFLSSKHCANDEEEMDFLCILMRYESLNLTSAREQIKDNLNSEEIDRATYEQIFKEQRTEFYRIYNYPGCKILEVIENNELMEFDHERKVKCLNGLSHFVEVSLRRKKFDTIDSVLIYIFNNLKYNYHDVFKQKLERINRARKEDRKSYDEYITSGSVGDRYHAAGLKNPTSSSGLKVITHKQMGALRDFKSNKSGGDFSEKLLQALMDEK